MSAYGSAYLAALERARLAAVAREAAKPLNHGLRFLNADGSRNEAAIERAIERRVAHHLHTAPGLYGAEDWCRDAIATVGAEVGGEQQIWNVRAGHVEPLNAEPGEYADDFRQWRYDRDRARGL